MKIAISGASGFVGSNLCSLLKKQTGNYKIIALDITEGFDLSDKSQTKTIGKFDVFVHLANLAFVPASYQDPELFYRTNYLTTLNALELCRLYKAKFVYVSSYIYGPPEYLPVDELHTINPFNPYAQSKVICESLCEGYYRDFAIPITILRPFNIYGLNQGGNLLIPEIIQQLKQGCSEILLKTSSPKRDYVNVLDVALALQAAINKETNGIASYNICSGKSYSVLELTEIINSHLKNKVKFKFLGTDRSIEVNETRGSNLKIFNELGWQPNIDLSEGIKEIIKYEKLS
jgi:UDP-glucose 4-epimerase